MIDLVLAERLNSALSTPRLTLWPTSAEHSSSFAAALADPALHTHIGGKPLREPEWAAKLRAWESRASPDGSEGWLNWAVAEQATGSVVGWAQATLSADAACLAYVIGTPWQRQGYATEAVEAVIARLSPAFRVIARIPHANTLSRLVAANAGLRPTGESDADGEELFLLDL